MARSGPSPLSCIAFTLCLIYPLRAAAPTDWKRSGTSEDRVPEGAVSLAFVLGVTGSLQRHAAQVADGLQTILKASQRDEPLFYNYILVPFHDPGEQYPMNLALVC
ncbi:hypothetical protein HPB48_026077 [Haemaphysalis longicornis]|uniref:Hemicentin-1-like von Willebrand factor A domain-containing protein n=1 Tax=Haemaphysalis longicornis TaxID=44386 RepID=A0A9J6H084_HAELO|nr:hypothetical protein HPB48_026077 [Haemaphysalis longicornis]